MHVRVDEAGDQEPTLSRNHRGALRLLRGFTALDTSDAAILDQHAAFLDAIETFGRDEGDVGDPGALGRVRRAQREKDNEAGGERLLRGHSARSR